MSGIIVIRNSENLEEKSMVYLNSGYITDLTEVLDIYDTLRLADPEFAKELEESWAVKYIDMTNWNGGWFNRFLEAVKQMRLQDFNGKEVVHLPYIILTDTCLITLMQLDPRSGITSFPTRTIHIKDNWVWNAPQWLFEITLSVWASAIKPVLPSLAEQWFRLGTTVGEEIVALEQIQRDLPTEIFTKALRSVQYYMAHVCVKICHNMTFVLRDPRFYAEAPLPLLRLYSMLDLVVPRERPEADIYSS
ncbi:MAG: hypothetical protein DYG88_05750 [Chloroflexi bacterium CFX4]|nr:hypothetical protein [Chloroflexi bacterium CFX4]MDL1922885.1 hypothetical protein [Chloroflexi bacterium CFX3]